jgi:hypothetical protein
MRRRRNPRQPWKRGPLAWKVAGNSVEILGRLERQRRRFLSLRRAAVMLGVSTYALRDWTRRGDVKRSGPQFQYEIQELRRLVEWLCKRAKPFEAEDYLMRFTHYREGRDYPFRKLGASRFSWPKERSVLRPSEVARLAGCHTSLVVRAIHAGYLRGRRRTRCRWEISKRAWKDAFPMSLIHAFRMPPLPKGNQLSTRDVAQYLRDIGVTRTNQRYVRGLVAEGRLEGARSTPGGRKLFVTRASVIELRENFKKAC